MKKWKYQIPNSIVIYALYVMFLFLNYVMYKAND